MEFIPIKKESEKKNKKVKKLKLSTKDIIIKPDLSNLYKSIDTNVSTLHQVNKLLETGTNEVKSILSYECNVIYECRTCRTLYRSVINFISHKEKYCRKKFDISLDESDLTGNSKTDAIKNDRIFQSFHALEEYPQNKDLNKVNKKQEENTNFINDINIENELPTSNEHYLDTNCSAAYQNVKLSNVIDTADLKEQITELQNMINVRTIILEEQMSENQFEKSDSPIQMNMSDEENKILMPKSSASNLTCIMCGATFSTKKTLNVHIKTVHANQRIYYSCPCCVNTFANIWSVYRHLNKVHKKSYKQARKLRPQIMKKVNRKASMKNIGNAIKTSTLKTIAVTDNKNQKSMDHVESSKKFQNYNRYKKKLDTKPLSVYSQFCEMPINICNETTINIEHSDKALTDITPINNLPIYEIDNVDTTTNQNMIAKVFSKQDTISEQSSSLSEAYKHHETSIHIEDACNLTNEYWDKRKGENNYPSISNLTNYKNDFRSVPLQNIDKNESLSINENQDHFVPDENTIWLKTDELKRLAPKLRYKKKLSYNIKNSLTNSKEKDVVNMQEDKFRLQPLLLAQSKEKDQTLLIESQIAAIANFQKLQCLICKRKLKSISNLRRHIATNHINWNRYRCKLCDFKCFTKCDCVAHCNKVHNAQNNHMILTELVIKIPHNEYTYNENIMNLTSTKEKLSSATMNIISSNQSEISLDSNLCNSNVHVASQVENTIMNEQINECAESYEDVEHINMKNDDSINNNRNNITMENLLDYLMNHKKTSKLHLDTNPVLKKIVMEIILGSNNTNTTKQTDEAAKTNSDTNINTDIKNDEKNIAESKSYSFTDNMTYKRPKRNRMKPLNADFVYGTLCTF